MCGITGLWQKRGQSDLALRENIRQMADTLILRGPDDVGVWTDPLVGIALGHRRLAIVDLSSAGHQPMRSASGRFIVAFNGEIYNHLTLRAELQALGAAPLWIGHSDTETLLAGFEHWGVETTLQRCVGMFAISLWDIVKKTLYLARDRLGEKPLYFGWVGYGSGRAFVFGSELKALRAYPGFDASVCREALTQYMRFMYVPAPRSIYQGIYKLEPGCMVMVHGQPPNVAPMSPLRPGQVHSGMVMQRWWSMAHVVKAGIAKPVTDEAEGLRLLEAKLIEAVSLQSLADVPLGAFLSGGVDSSTIVALMQSQSSKPIKTFTIGFDEEGFDESLHSRAVARHLATDHHEMRMTAQIAQDLIPYLPHMYDEPFADSSQIPTHLVCRAARQQVTVVLSGDGGDELFGGYNRYLWGPRIWNRLSVLPTPVRKLLGSALALLPINAYKTLSTPLRWRGQDVVRLGDKVHKLADRLRNVNNIDQFYFSMVSEWSEPASLVLGQNGTNVQEPVSLLDDPLPLNNMEQPLSMMYRDSMTYLPDDILCKVDRAAMACSLETRVPFLDHRLVELSWQLPLNMKVRGNTGKWALRQVLYKYVPKELIERPKAGFAMPIGHWLRGPLRDWTESLISEQRLKSEGYFRPAPIRQAWAEHLSGKRDNTSKLWSVLMFQAWLEKNR
jgi:asparagine synthase (glutamine-hydrolysing)